MQSAGPQLNRINQGQIMFACVYPAEETAVAYRQELQAFALRFLLWNNSPWYSRGALFPVVALAWGNLVLHVVLGFMFSGCYVCF